MTIFQTARGWLFANRGAIFSAIKVLGVVFLVLFVIASYLAIAVGAITIGLPLAAAFLIALVLFFAIAWMPFAFVVFILGLFGYGRSILTHRSRNTLFAACISVFVADMFSSELKNSPLFNIMNLPESAYAGYAAISISISALLCFRFVYLDGLSLLLKPTSSTDKFLKVKNALIFPSFFFIALLVDFLLPVAFTAIVFDRHGCEGVHLSSQFLTEIDGEYGLVEIWKVIVKSINEAQIWQDGWEKINYIATSAYEKTPIANSLVNRFAAYASTLPSWSLCDQGL